MPVPGATGSYTCELWEHTLKWNLSEIGRFFPNSQRCHHLCKYRHPGSLEDKSVIWSQPACPQILAPPCCVTLGKALNLSVLQLPPLSNGERDGMYLMGLL